MRDSLPPVKTRGQRGGGDGEATEPDVQERCCGGGGLVGEQGTEGSCPRGRWSGADDA